MGGGSSSPPPAPTITTYGGQPNYIPQFQSQNDVSLENLFNQMNATYSALPGQVLPQLQSISSQLTNNQYAPAAQTAANTAGGILSNTVAPQELQGGANLQGLSNAAVPYASQILQTGFDPQNALYDRTQQQVADQQRAALANAGLSGTPYGAGVEGQTLANFNIDWQNNLLNRENAAAQGYGNLVNTVGKGYAGSADLSNLGAQSTAAGGALPYSTNVGQLQTAGQGLSGLTSGTQAAFAPAQQLAGDYGSYLQIGNTASGTTDSAINQAYQNQLAAFNAQQQANQGLFGDIGSLLGGVGSAFSTGGFFGGGGPGGAGGLFDLSNLFSSSPQYASPIGPGLPGSPGW